MNKTKDENWTIEKRFSDIRRNGLIEAICEHGIGHHMGIHGCDGCCATLPEKLKDKVSRD